MTCIFYFGTLSCLGWTTICTIQLWMSCCPFWQVPVSAAFVALACGNSLQLGVASLTSFKQVKAGKGGGNLPWGCVWSPKNPRPAAWYVPMWATLEWSLLTIKEFLGCVFYSTSTWFVKQHPLATIYVFRMQLGKPSLLKTLALPASALRLCVISYCSTLQLRHEIS